VVECCVVGMADDDNLVKPVAYVVAAQDAERGEALVTSIQNHARASMAPYKYPRWVRFVAALPKNDRGKIDRKTVESWVASHENGNA